MKIVLMSLAFMLLAGTAYAETLAWDRNAEADMKDYQVYACFTSGCTVTKAAAMLQGTVMQTAVGVRPSFPVTLTGKEGAIAAAATDVSGNQSVSACRPLSTNCHLKRLRTRRFSEPCGLDVMHERDPWHIE